MTRVLTPLYQVGLMDKPNPNTNRNASLAANVSTAESQDAARTVAEDSTVLLKNDGPLLPLNAAAIKKLVLVGLPGGLWANRYVADFITGGLGSGSISPSYQPTFLNILGGRVAVDHHGAADEAAQQAAAEADVVIVGLTTTSGEGSDRVNVSFDCPLPHSQPQKQDEMVRNISAVAGKKTVVIATSSGAVVMPWADSVGAILLAFMPGQQFGEALTRLLFGEASPSGRLPVTIGNKDNEYGWTDEQFPGVGGVVTYSEGLFVGYRWYDKHGVAPAFPFGHGLSYTHFAYSALAVKASGSGATAAVSVANSGTAPGREVAQLYLTFPGSDPFEPKRILKGFHKTQPLSPGQAETVTFALTERDLSLWLGGRWAKSTGTFGVAVGASSRDIRLETTMDIG